MEVLAYVLTGMLAGLLGIGGGLVIVPALAFLLSRHGFGVANLMHFAVGTSLGGTVFTSALLLGNLKIVTLGQSVTRWSMIKWLACAWRCRTIPSNQFRRATGPEVLVLQ